MQEYLLRQKEQKQQKQKKEIVIAMRLAEALKVKYGEGALDFLAGIVAEKITEEEVVSLIEDLEKTNKQS